MNKKLIYIGIIILALFIKEYWMNLLEENFVMTGVESLIEHFKDQGFILTIYGLVFPTILLILFNKERIMIYISILLIINSVLVFAFPYMLESDLESWLYLHVTYILIFVLTVSGFMIVFYTENKVIGLFAILFGMQLLFTTEIAYDIIFSFYGQGHEYTQDIIVSYNLFNEYVRYFIVLFEIYIVYKLVDEHNFE